MARSKHTTTREERARELIATGAVQLLPGTGTAVVRGSQGDLYTVTKDGCTCPAGQHGRECYHVAAVRALCAEYHGTRAAISAREPGQKVRVSAALIKAMQTYYAAKANPAAVA